LNRREIVMAALAGEPTPRFPVLGPGGLINVVTRTVLDRFGIPLPAAHYSGVMMAELAAAAYDMVGFDNVGTPLCLTVEAEALGAKVDVGDGTALPRIVAFPELPTEDVIANALPALLNHGRVPQVLRSVELLRSMRPGIPIIGNMAGPTTLAASLIRPSSMIELVKRDPGFLNRLLEGIVSFLCAYAEAMVENGADIIMIHEPAARSGSYMGFDLFHNVLPYFNELSRYAHIGGAKVILHVCGGRMDQVRMCREAAVDAYSFEAEVDPGEAHAILHKPIIGTVPASLVHYFPPEMVLEETLMAVRNGATLMAPPCGLGLDTPFQNLRIMKEASHRFGV
jgi:[methyl-Co(III) methanol-specific corrinoid protein]:coenzyme M methyltransferase